MAKTNPDKLADSIDKRLLDVIDNGVEVNDGNGGTVKVTAPAKYLEVAMKRLEQLGALDGARTGTPAGELAKRAARIKKAFGGSLKIAGDGPEPMPEAESA